MASDAAGNDVEDPKKRQERRDRRKKRKETNWTYYNALSTVLVLALSLDVASSARFQFFKNWSNVELFYQIGMICTGVSIALGLVQKIYLIYSKKTQTGVFFSILSVVTAATCIAHTVIFALGLKKYNDAVNEFGQDSGQAREVAEYYLVNGEKRDHLLRCILALASSVLYVLALVLSLCMSICAKEGGDNIKNKK